MKSCRAGNRDFLRVCAHACMCTSSCVRTNTRAFTSTLQLFWKRTVPQSVLKGRTETGGVRSAVTQPRRAPPLQSRRQPAPTSKSHLPAGPVRSFPRLWVHRPRRTRPRCLPGCSHRWGTRPSHPRPCTAPMTAPSVTEGEDDVLRSLGHSEGILKGHSRRHRDLTKLFCWVINVTTPLQTRVCFVISSSHPKRICWAILRNRKRLWPIFRPSDFATKKEKRSYNVSLLFF